MDKGSRQAQNHNQDNKLAKKIKNFIYHPSDQVGSGFSSHVYKGVNELQSDPAKKNIAIKVIQLSKIQNEVQNYLLNNQVNALKLLKHPNILNTVDILMTKNNVYIVTQFCEGGDLLKHIKNNGPFSQLQAMRLIKDIVQGYKCIQENNIIHRDLKTSNIFLSKGKAKIADFGFCEFVGEKKPQIAYNVGSPAYMSPQSYKENNYSYKSDIWAIGIILYELLIGETPDRTLTYTEMANNLNNGKIKNIQNQEIKKILNLCFKKNLKQRIDAIGLAELVSIQFNRLQRINNITNNNQNSARQSTTQRNNGTSIRNLSPSKGGISNKDIKFFRAEVPYPKIPVSTGTAINSSLTNNGNAINRNSQSSLGEQPVSRKSITRQRVSQTKTGQVNQFKAHTQYLLFLYRLLKFITQLKIQKTNLALLPLFRHRSYIQSLVEALAQTLQINSNNSDQQQYYKQFQYLKNRFDECYLQYSKQIPKNASNNIYKQRMDLLSNGVFVQPDHLAFYKSIIADICSQLLGVLQNVNNKANPFFNRSQIAIVFDYLMIWHQLLNLHLQGLPLLNIINISKLQIVIKQQPKKISPGHIELLKMKYNHFISPLNQISKQSSSKQRIISTKSNVINNQSSSSTINSNMPPPQQMAINNNSELYRNMTSIQNINGFMPVVQQGVQAQQIVLPNPNNNPQFGFIQYGNNINQIPVHQSIMMPR